MDTLRALGRLGPLDLRNLGRDPLLRWMALLPLLVALPARIVLPPVLSRAGEALAVDLSAYYPVLLGYALVLLAPVMSGVVVGFLLLDQRDDGTLAALRVTPLPLDGYLAYRLVAPMLLSVAMTPVVLPLAGVAVLGPGEMLLAGLAAAPVAPLAALALPAFAENKVQGLALMKASSVVLIAPIATLFAPDAVKLALAVLPTYWPGQVYWTLLRGGGGAWLYLLGSYAVNALLTVLLLRRLRRTLGSY